MIKKIARSNDIMIISKVDILDGHGINLTIRLKGENETIDDVLNRVARDLNKDGAKTAALHVPEGMEYDKILELLCQKCANDRLTYTISVMHNYIVPDSNSWIGPLVTKV